MGMTSCEFRREWTEHAEYRMLNFECRRKSKLVVLRATVLVLF